MLGVPRALTCAIAAVALWVWDQRLLAVGFGILSSLAIYFCIRRGRIAATLQLVLRGMMFIIAVNFLLGLIFHRFHIPSIKRSFSADAWKPARKDWLDVYAREMEPLHNVEYDFLSWKTPDATGRYINVNNGARATVSANDSGDPGAKEVVFLGGSALWGDGVRDEHTIPSEFAKLVKASGERAHVLNFAERGFVSWQEVQRLALLLALGGRPDVVVLYDGYYDFWAQAQNPSTGPTYLNEVRDRQFLEHPDDPRRNLLAFSLYHRFFGPGPRFGMTSPDLEIKTLIENSTRSHRASIDMAYRLAASYGFQLFTFWQPSVYTKALRPEEESILAASAPLGEAYRAVVAARDPRVVDLTRCLDEIDAPVLLDQQRVNERATPVIARQIFDQVREAFATHASRLDIGAAEAPR